jgi:RNA polymerase sigma-70 factor (TIGR02943 family)
MHPKKELLPETWVNKYSDELFRYTLVRINDTGLAEDIVQETFLSAWRARADFKAETSEKNWLYAICKNKIIDHFRKQTNNISDLSIAEEHIYFDGAAHWRNQTTPKDWGLNYQQKIETKEFYSILDSCKKKLKDIQQTVFVMKYMEDMEAEKICRVLDITASNYWVLIHRCRLHLRSCLEKNWINI